MPNKQTPNGMAIARRKKPTKTTKRGTAKTTKGRRNGYDPRVVEDICLLLKETGSPDAVTEFISEGTFKRWRKQNPEFDQKVDDALAAFRRTRAQRFISLARDWLNTYLEEGEVIKRVTETPDGKYTTTIYKPCPQWVIDRVLGTMSQEIQERKRFSEPIEITVIDAETYDPEA